MLDIWAREGGAKDFAALDGERQAALKERLKRDLRTNRYDAKLDTITVSNVRARAMGVTAAHYAALFSTDSALEELRVQYAIPKRSLIDTEQRRQLGAFFFWIAWTSVTERRNHLYHNWPHEPLVGNTPSASLGMWSIASVLFLIAGIGWPLWYQRRRGDEAHAAVPAADPFLTMKPTPSMRRRPNIRHRHRDVARAILLFTGLMIWLTLVGRALWPALRTRNETRGLIAMVFIC